MKQILVVYGTTDGHTAKIAREIGMSLRDAGAEAHVMLASRHLDGPAAYDGVIVAASLRAGRFQKPVRRWVQRHAAALETLPTAFVPVCLAVRAPNGASQVQSVLSGFFEGCGWHPTVVKPMAGALLYTRYSWFTRRVMKRIVAKAGGDIDTTRDFIYTDWADLRRFAADFARDVASAHPTLAGVA